MAGGCVGRTIARRGAVRSCHHGRMPDSTEKRVSWSELFFDLVFVFAVTEVSTLLEHDHSRAGALRALIVFVAVCWVWVGTTILSDVSDMSGPGLRLVSFGVALCGMFVALAVPQAYEDRGMLLAFSYLAARLLLGFVIRLRAKWTINPVTVSMVFTGPVLALGAIWHGPVREALGGSLHSSNSPVPVIAAPQTERHAVRSGTSRRTIRSIRTHRPRRVGGRHRRVCAIVRLVELRCRGCGCRLICRQLRAVVGVLQLCRRRCPSCIGERASAVGHRPPSAVVWPPGIHRRDHHRRCRPSRGGDSSLHCVVDRSDGTRFRWRSAVSGELRLHTLDDFPTGFGDSSDLWSRGTGGDVAVLVPPCRCGPGGIGGHPLGLNTVKCLGVAQFGWRTLLRGKVT